MSKRLDLQVVVSGVLDGTLQSAIQNATGMLNRLKGASRGRMNFNTDSLSRALTELQKIQAGAGAVEQAIAEGESSKRRKRYKRKKIWRRHTTRTMMHRPILITRGTTCQTRSRRRRASCNRAQ